MNRIKKLREEIGMSQVRLSIELEVAQETVSAYEHGKHYPSVPNLIKLSKIFSTSTDYILGLSDLRYTPRAEATEPKRQRFLAEYDALTPVQQKLALAYIRGMLDANKNLGE